MSKPRPARRSGELDDSSAAAFRGAALVLGGREIPLRSGAMHYWRLRRDGWRDGLRAVRAMGLSIVETYVPWGVHEIAPGEFDFGQRDERKDLGAFLDMAAEEDLVAFVRPGPHINAELTWFGLPERIVYDPAIQARSPRGNPVVLFFPPRMFPVPSHASDAYHEEIGVWYDAVGEIVAPRLHPNGPVGMLQVDNEVGFFFRNGPFCQDYHPDALVLWADFLLNRHGSLAAVAAAHEQSYDDITDARAPRRFGEGRHGEVPSRGEFTRQIDWAAFQEFLLTHAIHRMRKRMKKAGLDAPTVHNVSLGEGGLQASIPALDRIVDLVGLDYYHPASEHRAIKRRTLYLAGTVEAPYAPELGVGAPPWFTPLSHHDSITCALLASAYGLRGFNLYMVVDRERWYGAPVDVSGHPRPEATDWDRLIAALERTRFHSLEREVHVGLVVPREYARFTRATHLYGPISPSTLEAIGGAPTDGCRQDDLGFERPIQLEWWRALERTAAALTEAGVPYVYIDSDAPARRFRGLRVLLCPTFEMVSEETWARLLKANEHAHVVYGPELPTLDDRFEPREFDKPGGRGPVDLTQDRVVGATVHDWIDRFDLARPYPAMPPPIETTVHRDGDRDVVLFVINPSPDEALAEVRLPEPTAARDLLSGEVFEGDETMEVRMAPQSVRLLELDAPSGRRENAPRARRKADS